MVEKERAVREEMDISLETAKEEKEKEKEARAKVSRENAGSVANLDTAKTTAQTTRKVDSTKSVKEKDSKQIPTAKLDVACQIPQWKDPSKSSMSNT